MVTVVIGTGPAGVSAALPLVEAGLPVILVDGGYKVADLDVTQPYEQFRRTNVNQAFTFIGPASYAIRNAKTGGSNRALLGWRVASLAFKNITGPQTTAFT